MRKLSPLKAISHALNSVMTYKYVAMRIGAFWIPVLFALGLLDLWVGPPDTQALEFGPAAVMQLASAFVTLIAVCSMAVSWHRFILRDELVTPARLDTQVFRYAGNTLLIMLMVLVPIVALAVAISVLPPVASIMLIPAALLMGGIVTRLSIKLPAVALGRTYFSFNDAWAASSGNFWQLLGVFLLSAAVFFGIVLVLMVVMGGISQFSPTAAQVVGLIAGAVIQLFYTVFNASIFTSLYGFFVERRDF